MRLSCKIESIVATVAISSLVVLAMAFSVKWHKSKTSELYLIGEITKSDLPESYKGNWDGIRFLYLDERSKKEVAEILGLFSNPIQPTSGLLMVIEGDLSGQKKITKESTREIENLYTKKAKDSVFVYGVNRSELNLPSGLGVK